MTQRPFSAAPALGWPATIVGNRGDILDRHNFDTGLLDAANGGVTAGAGTLDLHFSAGASRALERRARPSSAANCAAKGVLLRLPLYPATPELAQAITLPCGSVIETIVLLNEDLMWDHTGCDVLPVALTRTAGWGLLCHVDLSPGLLPDGLLLVGDGALRSLAGAGVGVCALPADGKTLAVTDALQATDLNLALNVALHVAA